jgi:DNA polymerase-1
MRYITFNDDQSSAYPVCILLKHLRSKDMTDAYVKPLEALGVDHSKVIGVQLDIGKVNKKTRLAYFQEQLLPNLVKVSVEYLVVCDAECYKDLTKSQKAETAFGYVKPCVVPGFEFINVMYCPAYGQLFHNPSLIEKVSLTLNALSKHVAGNYRDPGADVIKFAEYPSHISRIAYWLDLFLHDSYELAVDIEAFGLKHYDAGIGTIAFAWNKHEGIAFCVDLNRTPEDSRQIRALLKDFFRRSQAKRLYHQINYDAYVLIYQLFMADLLDTIGMYEGMNCLLNNWDDTKLIAYLATNSCAGNRLRLKEQAQEFAGDWAVEVEDITTVPEADLLRYNLIDALSTWYVHEKRYPQMVADDQEEIYLNLFKPAMWDIIQMQLTGLPIDLEEVALGKAEMQAASDAAVATVQTSPIVVEMQAYLAEAWAIQRNSELKRKRVTGADFKDDFNLNSPPQLQHLLYKWMGLPVIDFSDSKQPATGGDTLKKLINHTDDPLKIEVLKALIAFKQVDKILTAFIPAFEAAPLAPDGWHYLFGAFNLGGTVSGRLSSSNVNLQQLPATKSVYAKTVKKMFRTKPGSGWLLVGLDFNGLEDRISALTTKDPNKLKVYTDGYDGHCLRAYSYFKEEMPDIEDTVESINSIEKKYKHLRQKSKNPTFALTYQGTHIAVMNQTGSTIEAAKEITARYHELYQVSDQWVAERIAQAGKDGYVTVAFGLKLRTPLLRQVILGTRKTPFEAEAEGRTAGNALGQSYGLLNSRAAMDFMQRVRSSKYKHLIRPCAQIHDAQYYLVRDDYDVIHWVNEKLVKCVQWTELPEIQHPVVKLGGELSIFYPSWADELTLPNGASVTTIRQLAKQHVQPKEQKAA